MQQTGAHFQGESYKEDKDEKGVWGVGNLRLFKMISRHGLFSLIGDLEQSAVFQCRCYSGANTAAPLSRGSQKL